MGTVNHNAVTMSINNTHTSGWYKYETLVVQKNTKLLHFFLH